MTSRPSDIVVVGAARTPNGKFKGGLAALSAVTLGGLAIAAAVERSGVPASLVDTVVMGNVLQAGLGQCPARQAAVSAGLGWEVTASTVNRVCLSGISAIIDAARMIRCGDAHVAVAGGMESMTNSAHLLVGSRFGYGFGNFTAVDSMANDGLSDAWTHESMGLDTERRLAQYPVSRVEQDEVSARSHELAAQAWAGGAFGVEVVPVTVRTRTGDVVVDRDESIRPGTTIETLGTLRSAFTADGTITAGNSSPISDGAAVVVLTTRSRAKAEDWIVLATLRAYGQVAGPDAALAPQPANAIFAALTRQGWTVADLDLLEINEAFAAVAAHTVRHLGVAWDRVNVHGGAVALGHPIGQSGARMVGHLAHELHRRGGGRAVAALCGGTGQGDAILLEA